MFRFISELTFYGILFYVVTLICGFVAGMWVSRFERDGDHLALIRNLLNIARSGRYTASSAFQQIKERLEAWESENAY